MRLLLPVCLSVALVAAVTARCPGADPDKLLYKGKAVAAWADDLKSPDARTRKDAADALAYFGPAAAEALPALIQALKDDDEDARGRVSGALQRLDRAALPALVKTLEEPASDAVRAGAAMTLGRMGQRARSAVTPLRQALKDKSNRVRLEAAYALWTIDNRNEADTAAVLIEGLNDPETRGQAADLLGAIYMNTGGGKVPAAAAVKGLRAALADGKPGVRQKAAQALAVMGPAAKDALESLQTALKDRDADVRLAAVDAVGRIASGPEVVTMLAGAMKDEDVGVRRQAVNSVANGGDAAVPALAAAMYTPALRDDATQALGRLGKAAVPELAKALADRDPALREQAAVALMFLGPDARDALPQLRKALADDDADVRAATVDTLGRLGVDAKEALPELRAALRDKDAAVREKAAMAMANMGAEAKEAVEDLRKALKDESDGVRRQAISALASIGPDAAAAVPDLIAGLKDGVLAPDYSNALARMGAAAVPALVKALQDEDSGVRVQVILALSGIGPDARGAAAGLATVLTKDKEADVRRQAAASLPNIGADVKETTPPLLAALKGDKDASVRAQSAQSLGLLSGVNAKEVVPPLIKALSDADVGVRSNAATTLGQFGEDAKKAMPALLKLAKDNDEGLRNAAAVAAWLIDPKAAEKAGIPRPASVPPLPPPNR